MKEQSLSWMAAVLDLQEENGGAASARNSNFTFRAALLLPERGDIRGKFQWVGYRETGGSQARN